MDPGSYVKFDSCGSRKATQDRGGRGSVSGAKVGVIGKKQLKLRPVPVGDLTEGDLVADAEPIGRTSGARYKICL